MEMKLLNLNFAACSNDLLSDLVSLFLGYALFESLGSVVNKVLSFLKSKAGDLTSNLDNCELVSASRLKNNVKLGLLLCCGSCCCCAGSCCNCYGSCGYAEFLLKCFNEICEFKNGKTFNKVKNLCSLLVHFIILRIF